MFYSGHSWAMVLTVTFTFFRPISSHSARTWSLVIASFVLGQQRQLIQMTPMLRFALAQVPTAAKAARRTTFEEPNTKVLLSPTMSAPFTRTTNLTRSTSSITRTGASSSAPSCPSPSVSSAGLSTSTWPGRTTSLESSSPLPLSQLPSPLSGQEPRLQVVLKSVEKHSHSHRNNL